MTVFDRLETQLLDAHPNRARRAVPRPAPRRMLAVAASCAALGVIAIAGLSGGARTIPRTGVDPNAATIPAAKSPTSADGATASVTVLNATSTPGLAGRIASDFEQSGLHIGVVENAPIARTASRVYYRPGGERTAAIVAALLKLDGAAAAPPSLSRFTSVIVVAGHDRVHGPVITLCRGAVKTCARRRP